MFLTRMWVIAAVVTTSGMVASAGVAQAGVHIDKPNAAECSVVENPTENAVLANSGHYATASGAPTPYAWMCVDGNGNPYFALNIDHNVTPPTHHIIRYMVLPGHACDTTPFYLQVTAADGTKDRVRIHPILLNWNDTPASDDRVVGLTPSGSEQKRRTVSFTATGFQGVAPPEFHVRLYHNTNAQGQAGTGLLDVIEFDGVAANVSPVAACCMGGTCAVREWKVVNATVGASCGTPTTHTLTIVGDLTSLFMDDIELDLLVWQNGAPLVSCADGIGAVMDYTVASINVSVQEPNDPEIPESQELTRGTYAYRANELNSNGSIDNWWKLGTVDAVQPPMPGYLVRLENTSAPFPNRLRFTDRAAPTGSKFDTKDLGINSDLPYEFNVHANIPSANVRDGMLRVKLVKGGAEKGGGSCRDDVNESSVNITLTCPTAPPLDTPGSSTANGNEWTFDDPSPTLKIYFRATALPEDAVVRAQLAQRVNFTFSQSEPVIDGSTLAWDSPGDGTLDGWATHRDASASLPARWEAIAEFTTLPTDNDQFGKKHFRLRLFDEASLFWHRSSIKDTEVFYARDATNHPGGGTPNWFYYWGQVHQNANVAYVAGLAVPGNTPGLTGWSYAAAPNKTRIEVGPGILASGRQYGVGELLSGIDCFIGGILHEEKHVDQISRADALVPVAAGTCFQYGWSWNQGLSHNHWSKGADGQWGVAGTDDDGNGTIDDAVASPPFEPGHGDDGDLSYFADGSSSWPAAWALPVPNNGPTPVESEAINWADANINEHQYAAKDWGAPGKQHRTSNVWDD